MIAICSGSGGCTGGEVLWCWRPGRRRSCPSARCVIGRTTEIRVRAGGSRASNGSRTASMGRDKTRETDRPPIIVNLVRTEPMHLALNFQRVDPARGGAETYVADLCRYLVQAGHRVDLYAESWADGCLPSQVNVVKVVAPGRNKLERIKSFARRSEAILRLAHHDCSVGFINTWAHDVIIPQGGIHRASLTANAQRFATPLRQLYLLAKTANLKHWFHESIERRQYEPDRHAR